MPIRLRQFLQDWKTYAGMLSGAGAVALNWIDGFDDLPAPLKWLSICGLAFVTLWALLSSMSRKSTMLRPDRFLITTEKPEELVGRETDLADLLRQCEASRLVFMPGESGSGKSALAKAGLVAKLKSNSANLLPVYIDASLLEWRDGLATALTTELLRLSEDELVAIGVGPKTGDEQASQDKSLERPTVASLSTWLETLPTAAPRKLLIVVDQFDDYARRWKERLVVNGAVIDQSEMRKNSDWQLLARGVLDNRFHLLFTCRSEMQWALKTVHFEDKRKDPLRVIDRVPLARLAQKHVQRLLSRLTEDDGSGEVVLHPAFGWDQLKDRLLADLSAESGDVLAVQMVVAVGGLQQLRFLTVGQYDRNGGLTGLERAYTEDHVAAAALCGQGEGKVPYKKLLRGLEITFLAEDGQTTRQATLNALASEVLNEGSDPTHLEPAINYLESKRILRRNALADGSVQLTLYHAFCARGVRAAWIRANNSDSLLLEHSQNLQAAVTWSQSWQALLSPKEQIRLGWSWVRGNLKFGEHRALVLWSLFRFTPHIVLLFAISISVWQWKLDSDRRAAIACLAIGQADNPTQRELEKWRDLSTLPQRARIYALQYALENQPGNVTGRACWFMNAVAGLDPTGQIRRQIASDCILPQLEKSRIRDEKGLACLALLSQITAEPGDEVINAISDRIRTEKDAGAIASLGFTLVKLGAKFESEDIRPIAKVIGDRMQKEQSVETLVSLAAILGELGGKLDVNDIRPGAQAIVNGIEDENTSDDAVLELAEALAGLGNKLDPDDLRPAAKVLIAKMKVESDGSRVSRFGDTFSGLGRNLALADVRPAAQLLVERMESTKSRQTLSDLVFALESQRDDLDVRYFSMAAKAVTKQMSTEGTVAWKKIHGSTLSRLAHRLEAVDLRQGAEMLIALMESAEDSFEFFDLIDDVATLSAKLEPADLRPAAKLITDRIIEEPKGYSMPQLAEALSSISDRLDPDELQPAIESLVEKMKIETDDDKFFRLAIALSELSESARAEDVLPGALVAIDWVKNEQDPCPLRYIPPYVKQLCAKLEVGDFSQKAKALVQRIIVEQDLDILASLTELSTLLSNSVESSDVLPLARALAERMKSEKDVRKLSYVRAMLVDLSSKLHSDDLHLLALVLVDRMKIESDGIVVQEISEAMSVLVTRLKSEDLRPVLETLVVRLSGHWDSIDVTSLGRVLSVLSEKLEPSDLRSLAQALADKANTELDSKRLLVLAQVFSTLTGKLEVQDMEHFVNAIVERIETEPNRELLAGLVEAWLTLDCDLAGSNYDHLQNVLEILSLANVSDKLGEFNGIRSSVLKHLEEQHVVRPAKFDGSHWELVEWVKSSDNKKISTLNLDFRQH
ncbi:MAG: hypothetical protein AAFX06_21555 [Planctomycetota bacterium]